MIELLVALVVFALTTGAVAVVAQSALIAADDARYMESAGVWANRDLEMAKITGWANLPLGTVTSSGTPATGQWTGSVRYFDFVGNEVTLAEAPTRARFTLQRIIDDVDVVVSGTSYQLQPTTIRRVREVVRKYPGNTYLFTFGTNLVKGGV